jgi:hypothetical protein
MMIPTSGDSGMGVFHHITGGRRFQVPGSRFQVQGSRFRLQVREPELWNLELWNLEPFVTTQLSTAFVVAA